MQPQIPTPATYYFIIIYHPHLEGVFSPSRALGAPTTAPKQPDIPPPKKLPILPIMQPQIPPPATFVFIILTHPHLGRIMSPSRALRGPHQNPKTTRHTSQNYAFSLSCFQTVKVVSCNDKYPYQPHFVSAYRFIHIWEG